MTWRKNKQVTKRDRKSICEFFQSLLFLPCGPAAFLVERDLNVNLTSSGVTVTESK